MAFTDRQWGQLLTELEDRQVVPIVGPEALVLDVAGEKVPLYRYLARELAGRFEINQQGLPAEYGLAEVVSHYARQPGAVPDDAYTAVRQIMKEGRWPTPQPLTKLAEITHFDVYVSTTFDALLEQALNQIRFGNASRTRSFAYARTGRLVDLSDDVATRVQSLFYLDAADALRKALSDR